MTQYYALVQRCEQDPDYCEVSLHHSQSDAAQAACDFAEDEFLGKGTVRKAVLSREEAELLHGMATALMQTGRWVSGGEPGMRYVTTVELLRVQQDFRRHTPRWGRANPSG